MNDAAATSLVAQFSRRLAETGASMERLQSLGAAPAAIARRVAPGRGIRSTRDTGLVGLAWSQAGLEIDPGNFELTESTPLLSGCEFAVAETGSIVLSSAGVHHPLGNLTAGEHIVIVRAQQIVGTLEDAWQALGNLTRRSRSIVFITGASRTGDIEHRIEIGVHGALSLHVLLIDDAAV